jgi:hypothetical protein
MGADPEDPYTVGMFNGIELALSVMTGKEAEFIRCAGISPDENHRIQTPRREEPSAIPF